jgi:hypothetical protein
MEVNALFGVSGAVAALFGFKICKSATFVKTGYKEFHNLANKIIIPYQGLN